MRKARREVSIVHNNNVSNPHPFLSKGQSTTLDCLLRPKCITLFGLSNINGLVGETHRK